MQNEKKLYKAIVWDRSTEKSGERVSVIAESLSDARLLLEEKYGKGNVYDLHNEDESNRAR